MKLLLASILLVFSTTAFNATPAAPEALTPAQAASALAKASELANKNVKKKEFKRRVSASWAVEMPLPTSPANR